MPAMFVWLSDANTLASRSNRESRSASAENTSGRTLMATSRPSTVSLARHTSPIPPWPILSASRYCANVRPGSKVKGGLREKDDCRSRSCRPRLDFRAEVANMSLRFRRSGCAVVLVGLVLAAAPKVAAGDEKALIGSYAHVRRVTTDGKPLTSPDVVGFMTFTKTRRTVIMKWNAADGTPVSIAFIAAYTLSGGKYCEG